MLLKLQELLTALPATELRWLERDLKDRASEELWNIYRKRRRTPRNRGEAPEDRRAESDLVRWIGDWLAIRRLREHPDAMAWLRMESWMAYGADKAAAFEELKFPVRRERGPIRPFSNFWQHAFAGLELERSARVSGRGAALDFSRVLDPLDAFFIARKLQLACELINARNVLQVKGDLRMLEAVRQLAAVPPFSEDSAIALYSAVYDTLTEPGEPEHFHRLKDLVRTWSHRFSIPQQEEFYRYLKNYCVKQINTGTSAFLDELFAIYRLYLEQEALLDATGLAPGEFKNIVTIGLRLKQYDWVRGFIGRELHRLPESERLNAERYNLGNYYFHTRQFHSAIRIFQQVEFNDLYYQLDVRAILLKVYFELGEEELFIYHASAFRTFLSRNRKVSEYQRMIYRNFISLTARTLRYRDEPEGLRKVEAELLVSRQVADIRWLEEKLHELLRGNRRA
jgi:hypothetical protein